MNKETERKKIKVPDSWSDVTIGQFQEIAALDLRAKDYSVNLYSILLDQDTEDIRRYDSKSVATIMRNTEWVMKSPREDEYRQEIEVDGKLYRLIENLNGFSGCEFMDMEHYMEDLYPNLHYLFAMFYRLEGDDYNVAGFKDRGRLFAEKVMIGDVYGSLVFFSLVAKKSLLTTQHYLMNQMSAPTKTKLKNRRRLRLQSGAGTDSIIHWPREM